MTQYNNIIPYPNREILTDEYNNYYNTRANACARDTRAYARAREALPDQLQEIAEIFADVFSRPLSPWYRQQVEGYLSSGVQPDMICAVIAYTAGAPRPSWAYASAVLDRQIAQGARTAADFQGNVSSWRNSRSAAAPVKRVVEQQYGQREYKPGQFDDIPEDLLADLRSMNDERSHANA